MEREGRWEGRGGGGGGGERGDDERDWYLMCCAITSNCFSEIVRGIIQHLLYILYMHVHMYCEWCRCELSMVYDPTALPTCIPNTHCWKGNMLISVYIHVL